MSKAEVEPPWSAYPGYPPGDMFWRQPGEYYIWDVWEPYWNSLNAEEKEAYLTKWNVPEEWRHGSELINDDLRKMLDEIDAEYPPHEETEEEKLQRIKAVKLNFFAAKWARWLLIPVPVLINIAILVYVKGYFINALILFLAATSLLIAIVFLKKKYWTEKGGFVREIIWLPLLISLGLILRLFFKH